MTRPSRKKNVILPAEGLEDLEFYVPEMRLQEEGLKVCAGGLDLEPGRRKKGRVAISAKIVAARTTIGSPGLKDDLVNAGATRVDEVTLRDENQVSGRVVAGIRASCRELVTDLVDACK